MVDDRYPDGIDAAWMASDCNGRLGVFITAGLGYVPFCVLDSNRIPIHDDGTDDSIESRILELPVISEVHLMTPDSIACGYIEMAERGIFVYDWLDSERSVSKKTNTYDAVARPIHPLTISDLPALLAEAVADVMFAGLSFGDTLTIDIRQHVDWREGKWKHDMDMAIMKKLGAYEDPLG